MDLSVDPVAHARELRHAYDDVLGGKRAPGVLRPLVNESWRRSMAAGVDPERQIAPLSWGVPEAAERRAASPLARVVPVIERLLGGIADDAFHVVALSDAAGRLLWVDGHPAVKRRAEAMHFVEGARWSEDAAGTNAIGTALATAHSVQIFAAEHFARRVHPWTCSAAPLRDPATGDLLGVVDLTGPLRTVHPHSLALVTAAAREAETLLRADQGRRDEHLRELYLERVARRTHLATAVATRGGRILDSHPSGWLTAVPSLPAGGGAVTLADGTEIVGEPLGAGEGVLFWRSRPGDGRRGPPPLELSALGRDPDTVLVLGEGREITPRGAEILVLLALHPEGLSSEQLAVELYGPGGSAVTARAELHRLRRLAAPWIATRPYRLVGGIRADFVEARALAERGDLARAHRRYAGPLFPSSQAPGIARERRRLHRMMRRGTAPPSAL
jgi:hypothetical protein